MRTHFPWRELGYALGGLCLLLALYVGVYFASVTRRDHLGWGAGEAIPPKRLTRIR